MKKHRIICYCLICLLSLPQVSLAQTTTELNRDWSIFTTLKSKEKLVVKLKDGKNVEGRLHTVTEKALTLSKDGKTIDIDRENVARAYQVTGVPMKKPVLIGLTVGAAFGAAAGVAAGSCSPGDAVCFDRSETVPIVTAFCAGVGASIGLIIGKTRHKRVLIYEAM
jgi:small nuclear ribonucleoprotein (snRNP)-like protein